MNIRTAVILCGGKGTRLGLIGKKIPKTLVKIHGKPIIWYIIKILIKNKFNHFILPTGYKKNQIESFFKKKSKFLGKIKINIINTGIDTSISKRIFKIKNKIISDNFLLLNGDAIFDFNINKIFFQHIKKKKDATFIGCSTKLPYGVIVKRKNKITNFQRDIQFNSVKTENDESFIGFLYSGITILKKKLLDYKFKDFENFETSFYPKIIKKNKTNFEKLNGFFHSVDNYKDIDDVNSKGNKKKYNQIIKILKKINEVK